MRLAFSRNSSTSSLLACSFDASSRDKSIIRWYVSSFAARTLCFSLVNLKHVSICVDKRDGIPRIGFNCLESTVANTRTPPIKMLESRSLLNMMSITDNISADNCPISSTIKTSRVHKKLCKDGSRSIFMTASSADRCIVS